MAPIGNENVTKKIGNNKINIVINFHGFEMVHG